METRRQLQDSTAYARRCYVTVHVRDATPSHFAANPDDYVVSTTVNGEQVHGRCNASAPFADGFFECVSRAPLPLNTNGAYAFVTTFSVLETHYTKLLIGEIYDAPSPEIAQTKTATLDGLQRKFDWLRQYTRNALWASIILMLSALCWRVAFAAPYRGALAVLPATVLALGIGSIVATVRAFRVAYIPSMDRWKTAGRHTDEAI